MNIQAITPNQQIFNGRLIIKNAAKDKIEINPKDVLEIVDRRTSMPHYKESVIRLSVKGVGVKNQEVYGYNAASLWSFLRDKYDSLIVSDKERAMKNAQILQDYDNAKKV